MPSTKLSQRSKNNRDNHPSLNTQWIAGVQDKEGLTAHLLNSGDVLALVRLKEILKDKINEVDTKKISNSSYDNQNWAFRQAHTNGQLVTLKWIVEDLLPFVTDRTSK